MKVQRLFEIVYLLADRRTMTARELADHFGVSTRTILRDIATLSGAGIPVYATQGYRGGIHLLDQYVLNKTVLSPGEQGHVLAGLAALTQTSEDAESTLSRLKSLFALDEAAWLEIDLSRWGMTSTDRSMFRVLRDAILERCAIAFEYAGQYRTAMQRAYPLKLIYKGKAWYLQAARVRDEQYRIYKVTRMIEIEVLADVPTPGHLKPQPLEPDLAGANTAASSTAADTAPRSELETVRMKFSTTVRYRILDEYDPTAVKRTKSGYLVTIRVPIDAWLRGHILSYGTDVEVLAPEHLRRDVAATARDIATRYT